LANSRYQYYSKKITILLLKETSPLAKKSKTILILFSAWNSKHASRPKQHTITEIILKRAKRIPQFTCIAFNAGEL
jgi:hypothetical protein